MDETYIKVKRRWKYSYSVIAKDGSTIDCYLSYTKNTLAAKCFLSKVLKNYNTPSKINTDKKSCL